MWDVFGILARISPEQVDEWLAFDELEPVGRMRTDEILKLLGANLGAALGLSAGPAAFDPSPGEARGADDNPMSGDELTAQFLGSGLVI